MLTLVDHPILPGCVRVLSPLCCLSCFVNELRILFCAVGLGLVINIEVLDLTDFIWPTWKTVTLYPHLLQL